MMTPDTAWTMRARRLFLILIMLAVTAPATWMPATAIAQDKTDVDLPDLQLQRFRPATGPTDYFNVYSAAVAPHMEMDFGFYFDLADDPLQIPSFDAQFNPVVDSQSTLSLIGNIGLFDMFEVGLLLPVTVYQAGGSLVPVLDLPESEAVSKELPSWGINDPRVSVKYQLLDLLQNPVGVGFVANTYVPFGLDERFTSDDAIAIEGQAIGEMFLVRGIRIAANTGYRWRKNSAEFRDAIIGDEILWGIGANIPLFIRTLDAVLEIDGAVSIAEAPSGRGGVTASEAPVEGKLAARYAITDDWTATVGLGGSFNDEAIGSPDVRFFFGIGGRWVSGGKWGFDYDGDGIYGIHDDCPEDAEDFDGYEDTDGCPDLDNDGDGVPDDLDKCDNTPEGVQVGPDGCPDNDLDGDGIPNDRDECPEDPEDIDRFEDADGCPDVDNDQDGIPDTADTCPNEPETFNDFLDDDGCPDDPNDKVHISRDRIIITEQVHFETGKATIKKQSYEILDAVVEVMNENPQITKIRVEGHTDDRGSDDYNMELSQNRANSVMTYLVDNGVAERRLEAVGYGETTPIATNDTAKGRAQNRRVEFTILEMQEY